VILISTMIIGGVREVAGPGRAGAPIAGVREAASASGAGQAGAPIAGGVREVAVACRAGQAGAPIAGGVREVAGSGRFGRAVTPLVVVGWMRAASGSGRMCADRAVTGAAA
jgi:hypothetical protein